MVAKTVTRKPGGDAARKFHEALCRKMHSQRGVSTKAQFGSTALLIQGRVFTFPWKGDLVFKLPEERVAALVKAKHGKLFDPGSGRTSKTWVAVFPSARRLWPKLALEAKAFVASQK